MARRTATRRRIPTFSSPAEEAAFWDTHSPLDFPEEWVEEERPGRALGHVLGVRLDAATVAKLVELARAKGIGPSTLVRMWILERLQAGVVGGDRGLKDTD